MSVNDFPRTKLSRRALLEAAAGSVALVALPALAGTHARTAASAATVERASLGYWQGGALANPAHLRRGWLAPCASSRKHGCTAPLDGEVVDATRVAGSAGAYRVRIVGLANGARVLPLRIVAEHGGGARHEVWSAWAGGHSSPVATRMVSASGEALAFSLARAEGTTQDIALPAKSGAYLLALDVAPIRWRGVSLEARDATRPLARELVQRANGMAVASPYLLLAVERLA